MVFDPPSRQIAKTTLWASPHDQGASFDQVLSRPAFSGKSYEGFFPHKINVVQLTSPPKAIHLFGVGAPVTHRTAPSQPSA